MTEVSKQVEAHFHKTYKGFDSYYEKKNIFSRFIDEAFRKSMRLRFERVIEGVAPYEGKTVLDVGCGAGRFCFVLASKGIRESLGIDFARNMISEAERMARESCLEDVCRFKCGDFMKEEIHGTFSHVFAVGVMDYIDKPLPFIKKMKELATESVMVSFPSKGGIVQFFRKLIFRWIKKCPVFFYSRKDIVGIVEGLGIKEYTIDKLAKDYFLEFKI
jgi:2-polyprenyl-3-methyl-5-hydroxy-6-metoxy-1,4-benzoquinol methylase